MFRALDLGSHRCSRLKSFSQAPPSLPSDFLLSVFSLYPRFATYCEYRISSYCYYHEWLTSTERVRILKCTGFAGHGKVSCEWLALLVGCSLDPLMMSQISGTWLSPVQNLLTEQTQCTSYKNIHPFLKENCTQKMHTHTHTLIFHAVIHCLCLNSQCLHVRLHTSIGTIHHMSANYISC